jgi:hypothetical protein
MELADYLRNKSFNVNARSKFGQNSNGSNNIDLISNLLTQFISELKSMVRLITLLDHNAVELRRMLENLKLVEKTIDSNLNDRNLRPTDQRNANIMTEASIKLVRSFFNIKI